MSGKGTPATVAATRAKIEFTLHPYDAGSGTAAPQARPLRGAGGATGVGDRQHAYGLEAARALGIDPNRLFKTLVAEVDGALMVAVVPVSGSLDLKALAAAAGGKKAAMADPAAAERATGYVRGGISPLGQRKRLPTVVDASALATPTIYVSAGRRGLQIELAPADLVRLTGARTAPIARPADGG